MTAVNWTPDMDANLHAWAKQVPSPSVAKQARELGIGLGTAARRRKHLGIYSDTTATESAHKAKRADASIRRAGLEHRHLDRIDHILARLEAPSFKTVMRGEGGREEAVTQDFVPARDERDLSGAITQHWGALERVRRMDTNNGTSEAVSMLGGIAKLLTNAADTMPEEGP